MLLRGVVVYLHTTTRCTYHLHIHCVVVGSTTYYVVMHVPQVPYPPSSWWYGISREYPHTLSTGWWVDTLSVYYSSGYTYYSWWLVDTPLHNTHREMVHCWWMVSGWW